MSQIHTFEQRGKCAGCDELRAENERLREELAGLAELHQSEVDMADMHGAENERLREAQLTAEEAAYLLKFGDWPWAKDKDGLEASILTKLRARVDDNSALTEGGYRA